MEINAKIIGINAEASEKFAEMIAAKKFEEEYAIYQNVIMTTALANAENANQLIDKAVLLILGCNENYADDERLSADDIETFKGVAEDVKAKILLDGVAEGDYSKATDAMDAEEF